MKERISVLIPVFNVEKYLAQCLDSLYRQKQDIFEVVLVDDGSTDESGAICDQYREKYPDITHVYHKANEGAYASRNFALDHCSGDYVWLIDPDDYIVDGCLSLIIDAIAKNRFPDVVSLVYRKFKANEFFSYENEVDTAKIITGKDYLNQYTPCPYLWARVYRLSFLKEKGIRFNDRLYSQGDWIFNVRVNIEAKHILLTNIFAYNYNVGNLTSTLHLPSISKKKKNLGNTIVALSELNELILKYKGSDVVPALERQRSSTAMVFVYAMYVDNFDYRYVKEQLLKLEEMGIYPIGRCTNNLKKNLFLFIVNRKCLFLMICKFRNFFIKQRLTG